MEQTRGAFAKEKLGNLARWVDTEVGKENLPVDILMGINDRSELEVMMLCSILQSNKDKVTQRNWSGLGYLLKDHADVQEVFALINQREAMHAKFWRYMELFVELAEA